MSRRSTLSRCSLLSSIRSSFPPLGAVASAMELEPAADGVELEALDLVRICSPEVLGDPPTVNRGGVSAPLRL